MGVSGAPPVPRGSSTASTSFGTHRRGNSEQTPGEIRGRQRRPDQRLRLPCPQ